MIEQLVSHLPACTVHSTVRQEDDLDGWLAARKFGIGGSDIGAICGVSNYATPRLVYLTKTDQYEAEFSEASKERMAWGHKLEPIVANEFQERTGIKCVELDATMSNKDRPWALANVDRLMLDDEGIPYGILECKTAGEFMNEDWETGELPITYRYQLQWYMYVTGLRRGAFACLVGGNKFYWYDVFYDDDLVDGMLAHADKFWNHHVKNMIEPELIGSDADKDFINEKFINVEKDTVVELTDPLYEEALEFIVQAKKQVKEITTRITQAENYIKEGIKTSEKAFTPSFVVKWPSQTQNRVDTDKLKTEYPDIYNKVKKVITFRKMTITGGKDDE